MPPTDGWLDPTDAELESMKQLAKKYTAIGFDDPDLFELVGVYIPRLVATIRKSREAAPATCSEVVERLADIAIAYANEHLSATEFHNRATAILHSWRERRVQELERAVKIASCELAQGANMDFSDANIERWQEEAQRIEQQLLIEAREDLVKGGGSHGE